MNILELAADAGMLVVLDGRIGRTEYRSVHGTLDAFQRFVHALESALVDKEKSDGSQYGAACARSLRHLEEMVPEGRHGCPQADMECASGRCP